MSSHYPTDDQQKYSVWLENRLQDGYTPRQAVELLRKIFPNNDTRIKRLLEKRNSYISEGITIGRASRIVEKLNSCGLVCIVHSLSHSQDEEYINLELQCPERKEETVSIKTNENIIVDNIVKNTHENSFEGENFNFSQLANNVTDKCVESTKKLFSEVQAIIHGYMGPADRQYKKLSNTNFFIWLLILNIAILLSVIILTKGKLYKLYLIFIVCGFAFPVFSLYISKYLIVKSHNVKTIMHGRYRNEIEKFVYETVKELSTKASLEKVPDVGYYISPEINAFACGSSRENALIAFTVPLIQKLSPAQLKAVAAHEIAHIVNNDMIGTTLIQGSINAFTMMVTFPIRIIVELYRWFANAVLYTAQKDDPLMRFIYWCMCWFYKIVSNVIFVLGNLIAMLYSRTREYRADELAVYLVGHETVISVLEELRKDEELPPEEFIEYAAFKISNVQSFLELFSTHPTLENRILAVEKLFREDNKENM